MWETKQAALILLGSRCCQLCCMRDLIRPHLPLPPALLFIWDITQGPNRWSDFSEPCLTERNPRNVEAWHTRLWSRTSLQSSKINWSYALQLIVFDMHSVVLTASSLYLWCGISLASLQRKGKSLCSERWSSRGGAVWQPELLEMDTGCWIFRPGCGQAEREIVWR